MKKVLLVANVAKEHVLKFHIPAIQELKKQGWYVGVACSGNEAIPYCDHQYIMPYRRSPFNLGTIKGIFALRRVIANGKYDLVYCHTPVGGAVARLAARPYRKKGVKVVYVSHGYHFYKGAPLINWLLYYPIENCLSRITDAIITINKEDYALTKHRFKKCKAYYIPGIGVDFHRLDVRNRDEIRIQYRKKMNIPEEATVLIYLAELLPNKNQTFLMRVLKRIIEKNQNVYLILAGIDHSNGEFERYAETIGVKEHVRFLGWRNDIGNLYAMSDICTATSKREGFGLNLVEAMACGIPIVASHNRGHETIIQDGVNGFLVDQDDEASFAYHIEQIIKNPDYSKKAIAKGKQEVYKYGSERIVHTIINILDRQLYR